jgi:hypothetical protein
MTYTIHEQKQGEMMATSSRKFDELIHSAIKKVGGKKENDLCKYLPMNNGGYMHHFTLRKMKQQLPDELSKLIKTFITEVEKPITVAPKQRAARGSRKKKDQILLTKQDIDRILNLARSVGDKEVIRKLTPKKDRKTIKRELLSSIRNDRIEPELWNSYVESASQPNPFG